MCGVTISFFFFLTDFSFFREVLGSQWKLRERYRVFPYTSRPFSLSPMLTHSLPLHQHPPQRCVTFVIPESTLTHHHPKAIVYISVHSWCCIFSGLEKCIMTCIHHYNIQSISLLQCSAYSSLLIPHPYEHWPFYCWNYSCLKARFSFVLLFSEIWI